jgi:uncharacterized protein with NRDE domain
MCVVALALDAHPRWKLVLAANRDEFHSRPAAALARWDGADGHLLAGRDLQSGGTWLGVSDQGRLAVVTNIRTGVLPDPAKQSRGGLISQYLRGQGLPDATELDRYNAFSLISFGPEGATLTANRPGPMAQPLAAGIHGLSNGEPYESWPRKDRLMQAFAECLNSEAGLTEALFALLAAEGIGESIDDSIFIRDEIYGTRCSTVVLVGRDSGGVIAERLFDPAGNQSGDTQIQFQY